MSFTTVRCSASVSVSRSFVRSEARARGGEREMDRDRIEMFGWMMDG